MDKRRQVAVRQQPYPSPTSHCNTHLPASDNRRVFGELTAHAHNAAERRLTTPTSTDGDDDDSRDGDTAERLQMNTVSQKTTRVLAS